MYIFLWEYIVKPEHRTQFEKIYGPNGDWAQLFQQAEGYLGTDLLQDGDIPQRYITIDRWVSSKAYEIFHEKYHEAYAEMDVRCQSLTEHEKLIARGETISST